MAVIWRSQRQGVLYEVRTAGNTRRLYTDGVLHTQYNPRHPVTGSVWDLLMLPALLQPGRRFERVLVLGVGGGAVIHLLRRYTTTGSLTGVELNPLHLQVGRRFFSLQGENLDLVCGDAVQYMLDYDGEPFDLIIDDLFMEVEGEPCRAVTATPGWLRLLDSHLTRQGMLVMNFPLRRELAQCGFTAMPSLLRRYRSAFQLTHPQLENCIGAWLKFPASSRGLRDALASVPELAQARASGALNYRIRQTRGAG